MIIERSISGAGGKVGAKWNWDMPGMIGQWCGDEAIPKEGAPL